MLEPGDVVRLARRQDEVRGLEPRLQEALAWLPDDPTPLRTTARDLADLLRRFADDEALWAQFRNADRSLLALDTVQKARLRAVTEINWTGFLLHTGHRPPPPASDVSKAFRDEISAVVNALEPKAPDIDALRARIAEFAARLDGARTDLRPGWREKLEAYIQRLRPTLTQIALVDGTAIALGAGITALTGLLLPGLAAGGIGALVKIGATKLLERCFPPEIELRPPDTVEERLRLGERLKDALRTDEHGRIQTMLTQLATKRRAAPDGPSLLELQAMVTAKVDEVLAATLLSIEVLADRPEPWSLLNTLLRLADTCGHVARALIQQRPDLEEAQRWWPTFVDAWNKAADAIGRDHSNPLAAVTW